jgi:hypothetical protein
VRRTRSLSEVKRGSTLTSAETPPLLHLHDTLAEIERLDIPFVDRATLQEVLGCSTTEAWRILRKLGAAPGPGGALVLSKAVFLERLRAYNEDPRVVFERRRRERLETALDALSPHTRARLVKVVAEDRPADSVRLLSTRFGNLPAGVELTPHTASTSKFQGREEFLERLGAVLFALGNATEKVLGFVERGRRMSDGTLTSTERTPSE